VRGTGNCYGMQSCQLMEQGKSRGGERGRETVRETERGQTCKTSKFPCGGVSVRTETNDQLQDSHRGVEVEE
jgi:hypothetical protein